MANEWIPVKYLPDEEGYYLVYIHAPREYESENGGEWGYVSIAFFNKDQGGIWESGGSSMNFGCYLDRIDTKYEYYISHWMKLPESPIALGVDYEP